MAIQGQEGLLVDFDTGVVRQDRLLVQRAPGVVLFLGFGPRTRRLVSFACNDACDPDPDPFIARCQRIARSVECGSLAKAQDAGVPRAVLDIEDRTLRRLAIAEALAKADYNAGELRNTLGRWTTGGEVQVAQADEDLDPEDLADPLAQARQALWDAGMATLRQIDPDNANLTYLANPDTAPSQAALDRLGAAIEAAAIKRVTDKIMPDGVPIGEPGSSPQIREVPGGLQAAEDLFDYLGVGGRVYLSDSNLVVVQLPGNAGYITFRTMSLSQDPAIDINISGSDYLKLHYPARRSR